MASFKLVIEGKVIEVQGVAEEKQVLLAFGAVQTMIYTLAMELRDQGVFTVEPFAARLQRLVEHDSPGSLQKVWLEDFAAALTSGQRLSPSLTLIPGGKSDDPK